MPNLTGVSHDVSEAARALANASGRVMRRAMLAGHTAIPDIDAYCVANGALVHEAGAALAAAVRRDIVHAVEAERVRCRMAEYSADVAAARQACAETRPTVERAAGALADAQDVHREASGKYSRAYDNLQNLQDALYLMATEVT